MLYEIVWALVGSRLGEFGIRVVELGIGRVRWSTELSRGRIDETEMGDCEEAGSVDYDSEISVWSN